MSTQPAEIEGARLTAPSSVDAAVEVAHVDSGQEISPSSSPSPG